MSRFRIDCEPKSGHVLIQNYVKRCGILLDKVPLLPKRLQVFTRILTLCSIQLIKITIKHSVHASQKTQCISTTRTNRLTLFMQIIAAYCDNHVKHTGTGRIVLPGFWVPAATNTSNNRRIVGRMCLWVCLCVPLSMLGSNTVKTFSRQRIIVGGVVFYAVGVLSKESRRLMFPITSCFMVKVKLSLQQAMKVHRVVRRRGSHIF
jgi:hypothetical protein